MILPVTIKIFQSGGEAQTIQLPAEIWQRSGTWAFKTSTTNKLNKVILDPDKLVPDMDRSNNEWNTK